VGVQSRSTVVAVVARSSVDVELASEPRSLIRPRYWDGSVAVRPGALETGCVQIAAKCVVFTGTVRNLEWKRRG